MNTDMIELREVIEEIQGYVDGKITTEELDTWCSRVKFKTSVFLREKISVIDKIINGMTYDSNEIDLFIELEMNKFWYGMIELYTNINISEEELLTEDNYNLLGIFFYDWVLGYVEKDYKKFLKLFNEIYNYGLTKQIMMGFLEGLDELSETSRKNDEDFISLIKNDKNLIHDLSKIAMMGSQLNLSEEQDKNIEKNIENLAKDEKI